MAKRKSTQFEHIHVVGHFNHESDHESLNDIMPADVYFGRGERLLSMRQKIKQQTLSDRRWLQYQQKVASMTTPTSQTLLEIRVR